MSAATDGKQDVPRARDILLVEDDQGYALLMTDVLEEHTAARSVIVARDGVQALDLLRDEERELPALIILDLHLPRLDGRELLAVIKADPRLMAVPTAVMTGSDDPADARHAHSHHADAYLIKPSDLDSLLAAVHSLERFLPRAGSEARPEPQAASAADNGEAPAEA